MTTMTKLRLRLAVSVLILLACCAALAQDHSARVDQIAQFYVANGQFMGAVLVAEGDRIVFDKAYGYANEEWQVPNTVDAKFRLGSITKQFTAASILLLEERGKLKITDPVKQYMPDAPAAWDKMTLYHVLTHTAGIPNFTSFPDYQPTAGLATTPEQLVARFRDKPLDFQPGEKYSYSNSGYVLLGYLVEKISGQKYADFLRENIFKPLGMNDSGYDSNFTIIMHRASGYTRGANGLENTTYIHMTVPFAAGALYSTTHDLLKWEQALFGGKVLSAESLKKMTTPYKSDYALGVGVRTANGRTVVSHGGGIDGFNTYLAYWPDEKLTIVALSNVNGLAPDQIAATIARVFHGESVVLPSERKEVALAPDALKQYAGTYELRPGINIVVTVENGQLMTQVGPQAKQALFAEAPDKFFSKTADVQVDFAKNEKGEVVSLTLHQGGRDQKATRK